MALKPLTPGYLPLGQYDLLDSAPTIVGGEVGVFTTAESGDYYAADAGGSSITPDVKLTAGPVTSHPALFGLLDEGTSGYGTYYGTVIGGTVGQGTGFVTGVPSSSSSGTGFVVVGPRTSFASGKATLWTMPGLYGVTADAFSAAPTSVNQPLCGAASTGKLATGGASATVALSINTVSDSSLVSTSAAAATGSAATAEFYAVYLLGPQA